MCSGTLAESISSQIWNGGSWDGTPGQEKGGRATQGTWRGGQIGLEGGIDWVSLSLIVDFRQKSRGNAVVPAGPRLCEYTVSLKGGVGRMGLISNPDLILSNLAKWTHTGSQSSQSIYLTKRYGFGHK